MVMVMMMMIMIMIMMNGFALDGLHWCLFVEMWLVRDQLVSNIYPRER